MSDQTQGEPEGDGRQWRAAAIYSEQQNLYYFAFSGPKPKGQDDRLILVPKSTREAAEARVAELERQLAASRSPEAVERAAKAGVEHCREWLDGENGYCGARAEFILWGKLLKPEALGPRCYDHAAKHVGYSALVPGANFALFDLRPLAALDATSEKEKG